MNIILKILKYEIEFVRSFFGQIFIREVFLNFGRFVRMVIFPVIGTCVPFSVIIAFHGWSAMELFGAYRLLPGATTLTVFREVAPVISALTIIAVLGNSISSEIALMKLRGEFTYLQVIGVSPFRFVVFPRVVSFILTAACVFIIVSAASILGLFVYTVKIKGMPEGIFKENIWTMLSLTDLFGGLTKSVVFGLLIGQISTFLGIDAEESTEGVGKAASLTVIISSISFIIINVIMSFLIFGSIEPELR